VPYWCHLAGWGQLGGPNGRRHRLFLEGRSAHHMQFAAKTHRVHLHRYLGLKMLLFKPRVDYERKIHCLNYKIIYGSELFI
jgi:hypothetical protein